MPNILLTSCVKELKTKDKARVDLRNMERNPGSKEYKRSYESYKRKEYKMYEKKYVVDRLLWTAHVAEADDLIRVEKVNRKTGEVILQPLLKKKIVVSLKDFERDYKIV